MPSASQVRKQEEELEAIDDIVDGLIDDDFGDDEPVKEKSFSPSQPYLLSQKAELLKDALAEKQDAKSVSSSSI